MLTKFLYWHLVLELIQLLVAYEWSSTNGIILQWIQ